MTNDITKAVVATVDLGFEKIEGLMLPNGEYGVAIPQIAKSFRINQNTASRDLKRLLGDDFRPSKTKTELGNQSINVVTLEGFAKIIRALDRKGNTVANAFIDAIIQEGLERRFDRAFGKKVDEDERNQLIALRMKRIMARRLWTDTLRDRSLKLYNEKPTPEDYRLWTVLVNERLFNKRHFRCDRDNMEQWEQETIELFERMAERKAKLHPQSTPDDLVEMALSSFE
jgi:hypothetical protein